MIILTLKKIYVKIAILKNIKITELREDTNYENKRKISEIRRI